MSFLTPLALIGALLAIPIILLYMLRLRRREVLVSSTYLWQQLLQDNEANTPWQRLRRNLLLLLQLLILAALVLAMARPFITVPAVSAGQIILLLDASASMNATDMDGQSRFAAAQQEARNIVNTLGASDSMTVIRVTDVPEVIAPATSDRLALLAAIGSAQPSRASADWSSALTLAIGGLSSGGDFNLVVISDGGLGDPALLPEIPAEVSYIPVGREDNNIAISALATRALPGQNPQLFTQLTNYGSEEVEVVFSLTIDGELFTSSFYTIPASSDVSLVSEALPPGFAVIEAALTLPASSTQVDYLAEDNRAWAVASGAATRRALLMTEGNLFIEQALRSLPGVVAFQGDLERGLPAQPFDLYIFDGWLPPTLPEGDLLLINPPRSTPLFTVGAEVRGVQPARVQQDDPRMTFVDFNNVSILAYRQVTEATWANALIRSGDDPLLLAGDIDGRQVAILTFDIHNSDLPLQITWPILMANLLDWYAPQNVITTSSALNVGDSLLLRPPLTADLLRFTLPDGRQRDIPVDRRSIIYAETDLTGVYRLDVLEGETISQSQLFTVNLFDPGESDIAPQPSITLGGTVITPDTGDEVGQLELWPLVALLALLILLIEWYVYHQRLKTPPVLLRRPTTG